MEQRVAQAGTSQVWMLCSKAFSPTWYGAGERGRWTVLLDMQHPRGSPNCVS